MEFIEPETDATATTATRHHTEVPGCFEYPTIGSIDVPPVPFLRGISNITRKRAQKRFVETTTAASTSLTAGTGVTAATQPTAATKRTNHGLTGAVVRNNDNTTRREVNTALQKQRDRPCSVNEAIRERKVDEYLNKGGNSKSKPDKKKAKLEKGQPSLLLDKKGKGKEQPKEPQKPRVIKTSPNAKNTARGVNTGGKTQPAANKQSDIVLPELLPEKPPTKSVEYSNLLDYNYDSSSSRSNNNNKQSREPQTSPQHRYDERADYYGSSSSSNNNYDSYDDRQYRDDRRTRADSTNRDQGREYQQDYDYPSSRYSRDRDERDREEWAAPRFAGMPERDYTRYDEMRYNEREEHRNPGFFRAEGRDDPRNRPTEGAKGPQEDDRGNKQQDTTDLQRSPPGPRSSYDDREYSYNREATDYRDYDDRRRWDDRWNRYDERYDERSRNMYYDYGSRERDGYSYDRYGYDDRRYDDRDRRDYDRGRDDGGYRGYNSYEYDDRRPPTYDDRDREFRGGSRDRSERDSYSYDIRDDKDQDKNTGSPERREKSDEKKDTDTEVRRKDDIGKHAQSHSKARSHSHSHKEHSHDKHNDKDKHKSKSKSKKKGKGDEKKPDDSKYDFSLVKK